MPREHLKHSLLIIALTCVYRVPATYIQFIHMAVIGVAGGVLIDIDHFIVGMAIDPERIIAGAKTRDLEKFFDSIIGASNWNYTFWHPPVLGSAFILGSLFLSGPSLLVLRLVIATHFVADFGVPLLRRARS